MDVVSAKLRAPAPTGLSRSRLLDHLSCLWDRRLGLVVGPAGAGKTTLLAQLAGQADAAVAWYRADENDGAGPRLLAHLARALATVRSDLDGAWASVPDAAAALDRGEDRRTLLLVDDLHTLDGSDALGCLGELLAYRPPWLAVLAASRRIPAGLNVSRLRVSDELLLLDRDDLRFRSWEVEELFRDVYRQPMAPEDVALLTRRTGGWAAGLQLFHLATGGKSAAERHRALTSLETVPRLTRTYLARNVLEELPVELRRFLVHTSVLGRLDAALCDALLHRSDSHTLLAELERRELFVITEGTSHRYHEALRQHLEVALVEDVGEAEARAMYQRAGRLLREAGAVPEALLAFCRGEDWVAVERLLGTDGPRLTTAGRPWLEQLPAQLRDYDPWLLLAAARTHVAAGRLDEALATYRRAEHAFGTTSRAATCARERTMLAAWLEPLPSPTKGRSGMLRAATRRAPLQVPGITGQPGAGGELLAAASELLAGDVRRAHQRSLLVLEDPTAEPVLHATARLVAGVAGWLGGEPDARAEVARSLEACDGLGVAALARLGWILLLPARDGGDAAQRALASWRRENEGWGFALGALLRGLLHARTAGPGPALLAGAADTFHRLGAGVLEAWTRALLALQLAAENHSGAREECVAAEAIVHAAEAPGPELLLVLATAHTDSGRARDLVGRAEAMAARLGLSLEHLPLPPGKDGAGRSSDGPDRRPDARLRVLGSFEMQVGGQPVDVGSVRPQVATLLQLLAAHVGRPVHRESLVDALWPKAGPERGIHRLHVAISSLRGLLARTGNTVFLERDGSSYCLALPESADVDLWTFDAQRVVARGARSAGDEAAEREALQRLCDSYGGELLPAAGPADWVLVPRSRYRAEAVAAASRLAQLALDRNDPREAAEAAAWGLRVDRFQDELWRLAITAHTQAGDKAAASRAWGRYRAMLEELDLAGSSGAAWLADRQPPSTSTVTAT